jgi:hypothetical protein
MPKRGANKRVTYLFDYFDYNLFGIKLVNALIRSSGGGEWTVDSSSEWTVDLNNT